GRGARGHSGADVTQVYAERALSLVSRRRSPPRWGDVAAAPARLDAAAGAAAAPRRHRAGRRRQASRVTAPEPRRTRPPGAGVSSRNPRISPPGNWVVWMFRYALPAARPAARAASALAVVPPLAVTKAGV